MPEAHEQLEQAEHAEHAAHSNRKIALLIAVLALFLSFSETLGKSAQTEAISENVEAANLWSFFQAKTVRMTMVRTATEEMKVTAEAAISDPAAKEAMEKQIEAWQKTAARYDSEPETNEGRKELSARAKEAQERRDLELAKYHHYEISSAAFQIGIVLASAAVITGAVALVWLAGALGVAGLAIHGARPVRAAPRAPLFVGAETDAQTRQGRAAGGTQRPPLRGVARKSQAAQGAGARPCCDRVADVHGSAETGRGTAPTTPDFRRNRGRE